MAGAWSEFEVEATVADYLEMFAKELRGEPYNKAAHRRRLVSLLDGRSEGAVELKHQNISAALIELGYPYIPGYQPRFHYQRRLLGEVIRKQLENDASVVLAVRAAVEAPADVHVPIGDGLSRWEEAPSRSTDSRRYVAEGEEDAPQQRLRPKVNYLEREARNASLGLAGESFVVHLERARLRACGKDTLADRVEHVAVTEGDGLGFDVRSFEASGQDRLIEVKTTAYGKETPFFVTANEIEISSRHAAHYHLYRVFKFRQDPRLFAVQGALHDTCRLDPVQFRARVG